MPVDNYFSPCGSSDGEDFFDLIDAIFYEEPNAVSENHIKNVSAQQINSNFSDVKNSLQKDITRNYRQMAICKWKVKRLKAIKKELPTKKTICPKPNVKRSKENGRFVKSTMNFIKVSDIKHSIFD